MIKPITFATLCCLPLCGFGLQCDFHPHATANSVLDIQFHSEDFSGAYTLSAISLLPVSCPATAASPVAPMPEPQLAAMLAGNEGAASLDAFSLPLTRYSTAAESAAAASLHAKLLSAELQVRADRQAPDQPSLAAIPGSPETSIVPAEKRRSRRARRMTITSWTAFSQPVLLPTEEMAIPGKMTATPVSQTFTRSMAPMHQSMGTPSLAQVFTEASFSPAPKPYLLRASETTGTAFAALADAPARKSSHSSSAVKSAELPTVINVDTDSDQE